MLHVKMDNSIMLPSVEIPNLNMQNARSGEIPTIA